MSRRVLLVLLGLGLCAATPGHLLAQTPVIREILSFASLQPGPLAPGNFTLISGTNFSTTFTFIRSLPAPTTLAGLTVRINGMAVPLFQVTPNGIGIQAPWELFGQTQATIVVSSPNGVSAPFTAPVVPFFPTIYTQEGMVFRPDLSAVTSANPTQPGEPISVISQGLGPVSNQPATGQPSLASPLSMCNSTPTVRIGGTTGTVLFCGLAPGYVGIYQVNVRLHTNVPTGAEVPLALSGSASSNIRHIAVGTVRPTLKLSQDGILFTAVQGTGLLPNRNVGVLNIGQGTMSWTAAVAEPARTPWLSVTPGAGTTTAGSLSFPSLAVGANPTGLVPGAYTGQIRVTSAAAINSPQFLTVVLNVLPAGSRLPPLVEPSGLIFAAQAGTTSPVAKSITLTNANPAAATVTVTRATDEGGAWLDATPASLTLAPGGSQSVAVRAILGTLPVGVYRGRLTLTSSDGSASQVVNVLFIVSSDPVPASAVQALSAAGESLSVAEQGSACAPQRLVAVARSYNGSLTSAVGWPSVLEVQVADDCGAPVSNAAVVASFSSGDIPLELKRLGNGMYSGTWLPVRVTPQVTITIRAVLTTLAAAEVQLQFAVTDNPSAPAIFPGGVVNAAGFAAGQPVAPGSIVAIFGRRLSPATTEFSNVPLPLRLRGTSLTIGGMDVPLFFTSEGQINAQLPFQLPSSGRQQLIVKTGEEQGGTPSVALPETVTIVPAAPGIFLMDDTGRGAIVNAVTGQVVTPTTPIRRGEHIAIFGTGLGALKIPVVAGALPSALAETTDIPQVTIADVPAQVTFSGLAPTLVGVYQVNAIVPAGAPSGVQALRLTIRGAASNTVTIAIE